MQDLQQRNEQAKEALTAAFRIMDEDRSGNINHMEFLQTLKMLHYGDRLLSFWHKRMLGRMSTCPSRYTR